MPRKTGMSGSEGGRRKRTRQLAPRRRPTLPHAGFGGRLPGKGPYSPRDLAGQPTLRTPVSIPGLVPADRTPGQLAVIPQAKPRRWPR
jgi:hypothetical protein